MPGDRTGAVGVPVMLRYVMREPEPVRTQIQWMVLSPGVRLRAGLVTKLSFASPPAGGAKLKMSTNVSGTPV